VGNLVTAAGKWLDQFNRTSALFTIDDHFHPTIVQLNYSSTAYKKQCHSNSLRNYHIELVVT